MSDLIVLIPTLYLKNLETLHCGFVVQIETVRACCASTAIDCLPVFSLVTQ